MQAGGIITFFRLVRYPNLLIMAATQLLCSVYLTFIKWETLQYPAFWLILASTLLVAAGGYIVNDITDIAADTVNKPHKVFITEGNKTGYGKIYIAITAIGIAAGFFASIGTGCIALCMAALLWLYSKKLKQGLLTGNIAVAVMSASSILILYPLPGIYTGYLWIYAAFAFATTLLREIIKDIEDTEGDAAAGARTLPIVKGTLLARRAAIGSAGALLAALVLFIGWCLVHFKIVAVAYLTLLVAIPALGLLLLLRMATTKQHFSWASLYCKLLMLTGLLSVIFMV